MLVKDLIERLSKCPENAEVFVNYNRPEPNWLIDIDAVYDYDNTVEISIYPDGMEETVKLGE